MKRIISVITALVVIAAVLASCTPLYDKAPNEYKKIRWITPDYSFSINPDNDCSGKYNFEGKSYDIKAEFESSRLTAYDKGKSNAELFTADWTYDEDNHLYIYNIMYNTEDYPEFKNNYNEFYTLNKEKIK